MTWYDLRDEVVPFPGRAAHHALCPCHLGRHRLPGLLDVLSPAADRIGRRPRSPAARRLGADHRRLRPAARRRPARCLRRPLRPPGGTAPARSDRRADGLRRPHGRDQPVQQRAQSRPGRLPATVSQGRPEMSTDPASRQSDDVRSGRAGRADHRRRPRPRAGHGPGPGSRGRPDRRPRCRAADEPIPATRWARPTISRPWPASVAHSGSNA